MIEAAVVPILLFSTELIIGLWKKEEGVRGQGPHLHTSA